MGTYVCKKPPWMKFPRSRLLLRRVRADNIHLYLSRRLDFPKSGDIIAISFIIAFDDVKRISI